MLQLKCFATPYLHITLNRPPHVGEEPTQSEERIGEVTEASLLIAHGVAMFFWDLISHVSLCSNKQ